MNYIQNKLDTIDIFDYIVFEDGDIDTKKSNEKLKELFTDYHNHIVEMIPKKIILKNMYGDGWNDAIEVTSNNFSTLQDTNK